MHTPGLMVSPVFLVSRTGGYNMAVGLLVFKELSAFVDLEPMGCAGAFSLMTAVLEP